MLSRDEATALLAEYGGSATWTRHCLAVAEAAVGIGLALKPYRSVDLDSLWSVALLHDIGRYKSHDPIAHGVEGYLLLTQLGHHGAAFVCASHILFGLDASEAADVGLPAQDFIARTDEERVVPLADYLVEGERATTLDHRFSSLRQRNAGNAYFVSRLPRAYEAANSFSQELAATIGCPVESIVASTLGCS
jgi:uncharacterized protein